MEAYIKRLEELEALKKDIKAHASAKQGPESSWPKLAKSTMKKRRARRKKGKKVAVGILGKIRTQFDVEWGPKFIRAISRIPWSGAHADGDEVGRGSKLPARTLFYVSDEFLRKTVDRVLRRITSVF